MIYVWIFLTFFFPNQGFVYAEALKACTPEGDCEIVLVCFEGVCSDPDDIEPNVPGDDIP